MKELCTLCDSPTGGAGRGEDSLYIETNDGEVGPLCEECYSAVNKAIESCCKDLAEGQNKADNSASTPFVCGWHSEQPCSDQAVVYQCNANYGCQHKRRT